MKNYITRPLISKPGIQRDGTPYASQSYIDGQWCRFYMGRPRKIGGYKLIDVGNQEIIRSLFAVPGANTIDAYLGRESTISYNRFDFNGNGSGEIDRTPDTYVATFNNVWNMDLFTTTVPELTSYIVASAIPNGGDISNRTNGTVYQGNTANNNKLVPIIGTNSNPVEVSGGVVFVSPVMVAYGNDGFMRWSDEGDIMTWDPRNNIIIDNTKIINISLTRGGTNPQLLAWTLSSVLNLTYIPGAPAGKFSYSVISNKITVMSPNSIVEYDQQFFWIGTDQFYFFNGIVRRLENSMSTDWFFQNVNLQQRAKVWGMVVPRFKELWWFYPRGPNQTECNACIIYNTELNVWYDSFIARASGLSTSIFPLPLMADSVKETVSSGRGIINNFGLWMHEYGVDQEISSVQYAIDSYFETHIHTLFESNPELNRLIRTRRIEPDFAQTGNMTVTINNRMFPSDTVENGQTIQSGPYSFNEDTQKIDVNGTQGRLVSYVFDSNEAGGNYQLGQTLLDYEIGDVQPGSNP